jgi:hypothetical protein
VRPQPPRFPPLSNDTPPTSAAARAYFASHPAYTSWSPRALDAFLSSALRPTGGNSDSDSDGGGAVALKCAPEHETAVWELRTSFDVWEHLPTLRARVRLFWVMPRVESAFGRAQKVSRELVWRRGARAGNVVVEAGHLVSYARLHYWEGAVGAEGVVWAVGSDGEAGGAGGGGGGVFGGGVWGERGGGSAGEAVRGTDDGSEYALQMLVGSER